MTKSKLSLILSLTFSTILVVGIITFAILQTSTKPSLPNPDTIKIYNKSQSATKTITASNDEYAEILKIYNLMFEKTYLEQLADDNILEGTISEDLSAPLWEETNKVNGMYLEFEFSLAKKFIIYRNGSSRRVDIKKLIVPISKEDEVLKTYIYYTVEETTSSNSSTDKDKKEEPKEPCYPLVVEANTYNMYTYLKSII